MSNPTEHLNELGVPNNLLTRSLYRATRKLTYIALYASVAVVAVVTRKDKLEVVNALCVKVGVEPVTLD